VERKSHDYHAIGIASAKQADTIIGKVAGKRFHPWKIFPKQYRGWYPVEFKLPEFPIVILFGKEAFPFLSRQVLYVLVFLQGMKGFVVHAGVNEIEDREGGAHPDAWRLKLAEEAFRVGAAVKQGSALFFTGQVKEFLYMFYWLHPHGKLRGKMPLGMPHNRHPIDPGLLQQFEVDVFGQVPGNL